MRKFAILAAGIAAIVATPAFAQDDAKSTSFQVGGIVGYDSVKFSDGTDSASTDGVMYGITAGADFNLGGSAFIGVEAEYSDSEVGETYNDIFTVGDELHLGAGRTLYAGARLGTAVSSNAKVYVKGGYVNTSIKGSYDDGVDEVSDSAKIDGWLAGAGVDVKLSPVTVRVEYRYSDYGSLDIDGFSTGLDASRHQVVAGLLFGF